MDPLHLPSRHSTIALRPITAHNWRSVTKLLVNRDQLDLVPPNLESLCEHQFDAPRSIVRAIEADKVPVGYIRLVEQVDASSSSAQEEQHREQQQQRTSQEQEAPPRPTDASRVFLLQSFMIDQTCQGLGFGSKAMSLLQEEIRNLGSGHSKTAAAVIKVLTKPFAVIHPDDSPEHFFSGSGFTKNDHGQREEMIWES
ncbi:hypothetical protein B0O80DRAFT_499667 [Mortierella sp. GBAus27b]|nr:hypothetical protein B0O80DRAFT_499667 [Mortierella sp. GBAus27b]